MFRFLTYALPLLILLLALFGFVVELFDLEPSATAVIRLALLEPPKVPATVVLSAWIMEACGLLALYLLAQGRCGAWWMDGLVAGWLAWVFRGPLLVLTIVVAVRQPQDPWWELVFAWWWLYSICGLSLALLAKRSNLAGSLATPPDSPGTSAPDSPGTSAPDSPGTSAPDSPGTTAPATRPDSPGTPASEPEEARKDAAPSADTDAPLATAGAEVPGDRSDEQGTGQANDEAEHEAKDAHGGPDHPSPDHPSQDADPSKPSPPRSS